MTRPSINDIVGLGDYSALYRYEILFPSLPSAMPNRALYTSAKLNLRAVSTEYPKFTQDEIVINLHGHKDYIAGPPTYDPLTITFVETEDALIQRFVRDLTSLTWKPVRGTQAKRASYVFPTIILRPLASDNTATHEYTLKNAFITSHDMGSPDGSSTDVQKVQITLRFTHFLAEGQAGA